MKKKVLVMTIAAMLAASMAACGTAKKEETKVPETKVEETVTETEAAETKEAETEAAETEAAGGMMGLANPWAEADKEGVKKLIGVDFVELDTMKDIEYYVAESTGMAEMDFTCDGRPGASFEVRAQKTEELEDISGMYVTWTSGKEVEFGETPHYTGRVDEGKDGDQSVTRCMVYDADNGISYSIAGFGESTCGDDIVELAQFVTGSVK